MTATAGARPGLLRRALRLEYLTIGWNIVEGVVAIRRRGCGWRGSQKLVAGSLALLAVAGTYTLSSLEGHRRGRPLFTDDSALRPVQRPAQVRDEVVRRLYSDG
jgi:hypothetical protein